MSRASCRSLLLFLSSLAVAACTPVLEPVVEQKPQALTTTTRPARVLWVLDDSGSLEVPADPTSPSCPAGCGLGQPCPAACPTRKSILVGGLTSLGAQLAPARHGAVIFPSDNVCGAGASLAVPLPAAPSAGGLADVVQAYQARPPLGGTPTSATLTYVSTLADEPGADTYVVLVTDGLPNCNDNNPNHQCAGPNTSCRCTLASCGGALCAKGCLDDLETIEASRRITRKGWKLLVVGVGSELVGDGATTLSALDISLPPTCSVDADCRIGQCHEGVCDTRYFLVLDEADFRRPAQRITAALDGNGRCEWWLDIDVVSSGLTVELAGVAVPHADWALVGARQLSFVGDTCRQLLADPSLTPVVLWRPGSR